MSKREFTLTYNRTHAELPKHPMSLSKLLLTTLVLLACSGAWALDLATFRSLDPNELRAAEARMSEFIEPGTGRALREPRNASERYLVQRQQRHAEEFNRRAATATRADGEQIEPLFWPAARASRVTIGPDGRARIQCQPAQVVLGRALPDFRAVQPTARPAR